MAEYTCKHCGKELMPVLLWQCPEEMFDPANPGKAVYMTMDHAHTPAVEDGAAIMFPLAPPARGKPRVFLDPLEVEVDL